MAMVRGAPIMKYGSMDLREQDAPQSILQADESFYLHPGRARLPGPSAMAMVIGVDDYPDMVLEVDYTTDVRRGKLGLYEAWSFPEVWVEVPDVPSPTRPRGRRPGLLLRQAARKFGADTAQRLALLLEDADPDRLAQAGIGTIECKTAAELLDRVSR